MYIFTLSFMNGISFIATREARRLNSTFIFYFNSFYTKQTVLKTSILSYSGKVMSSNVL
ncbi:MAG: hypothetical protein JWQ40_3195 [Segetibacter sp.]|nr:hypothetical protein [Segetibacter sp.]